MNHFAGIIVHASTAEEAQSLAKDVATETLTGHNGVYEYVSLVTETDDPRPPAFALGSEWAELDEDGLRDRLADVKQPDSTPDHTGASQLAMFVEQTETEYADALDEIADITGDNLPSGNAIFDDDRLHTAFSRIGTNEGAYTYLYAQNGLGVRSLWDLKQALNTWDYANAAMVEEEGYQPFIVPVYFG